MRCNSNPLSPESEVCDVFSTRDLPKTSRRQSRAIIVASTIWGVSLAAMTKNLKVSFLRLVLVILLVYSSWNQYHLKLNYFIQYNSICLSFCLFLCLSSIYHAYKHINMQDIYIYTQRDSIIHMYVYIYIYYSIIYIYKTLQCTHIVLYIYV